MLLIAGPCMLESRELSLEVAEKVHAIAKRHSGSLTVVFKGSFDKANRTSPDSPRGLGIKEGLKILAEVKKTFGLPVLTDVHETSQCAEIGEVCDVIQIPAFLSRQTDLLVAAAKTGRCVNVKKGQFLSPHDMKFAVAKLRGAGASEIWQTERGTTFGYGNLVVDMRSFPIMAENNEPVIMDATPSIPSCPRWEATARSSTTLALLSRTCLIDPTFATISSIAAEDWDTHVAIELIISVNACTCSPVVLTFSEIELTVKEIVLVISS